MAYASFPSLRPQEAAKALFAGGGNTENMPTTALTDADFNEEGKLGILDLMVKAELVASKAEARRGIQQGGVTVNGEKINDPFTAYEKGDFATEFVIKKGKNSQPVLLVLPMCQN